MRWKHLNCYENYFNKFIYNFSFVIKLSRKLHFKTGMGKFSFLVKTLVRFWYQMINGLQVFQLIYSLISRIDRDCNYCINGKYFMHSLKSTHFDCVFNALSSDALNESDKYLRFFFYFFNSLHVLWKRWHQTYNQGNLFVLLLVFQWNYHISKHIFHANNLFVFYFFFEHFSLMPFPLKYIDFIWNFNSNMICIRNRNFAGFVLL